MQGGVDGEGLLEGVSGGVVVKGFGGEPLGWERGWGGEGVGGLGGCGLPVMGTWRRWW